MKFNKLTALGFAFGYFVSAYLISPNNNLIQRLADTCIGLSCSIACGFLLSHFKLWGLK